MNRKKIIIGALIVVAGGALVLAVLALALSVADGILEERRA